MNTPFGLELLQKKGSCPLTKREDTYTLTDTISKASKICPQAFSAPVHIIGPNPSTYS